MQKLLSKLLLAPFSLHGWKDTTVARTISNRILLTALLLLCGSFISYSASAATSITVNTTTDSIANDGQCSLREAILSANTNSAIGDCQAGIGADVIVFDLSLPDPAVFILTLAGANEDASAMGDLDLMGMINIQGTRADQIIIDGNGTDRVFDVQPGATVVISDVTIRNGNPGSGANGGGLIVTGGSPRAKLTLMNCFVMNNSAVIGGGIQIAGNGATAIIQDTQITSNIAAASGGGIANSGDLTLLNSALFQNKARTGGGIEHSGFSMKLTNVTVSNNNASDNGGGIYNRGDAIILNSTLNGNTASGQDTGGNIFHDTASLAIKNSILANSDTDGNCHVNEGFLTSQGNNLESGNSCGFDGSGDLVNMDPMLGPLQDNGGYTFTHALLAGSPAIDAGINSGCPSNDQRGYLRPVDGDLDDSAICDMGAYEFNTVTSTITPSPSPKASETPTATATLTSEPTGTPTTTPITPTPTPAPPSIPCVGAVLPLILFFLLIYKSDMRK